jgi:hypothetical protein
MFVVGSVCFGSVVGWATAGSGRLFRFDASLMLLILSFVTLAAGYVAGGSGAVASVGAGFLSGWIGHAVLHFGLASKTHPDESA